MFSNSLGQYTKYYDTKNTRPYSEVAVTQGADGKVTGAQIVLDQNIINAGGAIGQIFGSALGSALGGHDQLTRLTSSVVGGTIGGLIGQKFGLVVATSMAADLSKVSLADVFASQNLDIGSAGIGAVSSFLTAELGVPLLGDPRCRRRSPNSAELMLVRPFGREAEMRNISCSTTVSCTP